MAQTNPLRYRSYYYDSETGYYHHKSRYYSPEVGRWISPEPNVDYGEFDEGSEILGYNVYAYCFNNPVNNFDPKATAVLIGIGIGALIGGGAVGGGTTEVFKDVGSNVLGKVGKKLVEDGVDMALDLTQTATENGGLTGKDVLFSAVTSFGGDLVGAAKTNSTARNQLIDGATDNRAIKDAVGDSLTDNNTSKKALNSFDDRGYKPKPGERTLDGYVKNNVSTDAELSLSTNSSGFNNHDGITGGKFKRFGSEEHAGLSPHVHQPIRNEAPNGNIYGSVGSKTSNGGVTSPTEKDVKQLYQYLNNGKYQ